MKVCIHNGTDEQKTLKALKKAASQATGKARGVIQGLAKALSHNPAARGRTKKGDASMAKKRTRRATAKRRTAPNPTTHKRRYHRRRSNPTGLAAKVKGLNLTGILIEGAGVAAGSLASSFVSRQAARMMPDMNPALRTGLSTALVAGGLAYFGGGKGFLRNMAVGAVAGGITNIAASMAPGLFAGVDDDMGAIYEDISGWNPDGTYNEELGDAEEMGGVLFDTASGAPTGRSF